MKRLDRQQTRSILLRLKMKKNVIGIIKVSVNCKLQNRYNILIDSCINVHCTIKYSPLFIQLSLVVEVEGVNNLTSCIQQNVRNDNYLLEY